MAISPARMAAYRILSRIEVPRSLAVDLLQGPVVSRLQARDRDLATQLVMGVLRWRGDLDFQIERLSGRQFEYFDPEIVRILRLGIYQVRFLSRIPKPAAVHESVELVKAARKASAAPLVNAVLRKCEPLQSGGCDAAGSPPHSEYRESALRSVPEWIRDRWTRKFGTATATAMVLASQEVPRTSVRVAGADGERETVQRELAASGVQTSFGKYGRRALQVESGDVFTTEAWRQGRIAIQEEASQLVAELLRPAPGHSLLDLCAAPGLKASQLADDLQKGMLIACDRSLRRLKLLKNILRAPWPQDVRLGQTVLDASRSLPFQIGFERVLADVPCSGTGTLARNPEIKWRLRAEDLARFAQTQAKILSNGLSRLAPGGRLVYATCSLEPEENEEVVASALAIFPQCRLMQAAELRRDFSALASLFADDGYFRTWPGVQPLDGFFAAVINRDL